MKQRKVKMGMYNDKQGSVFVTYEELNNQIDSLNGNLGGRDLGFGEVKKPKKSKKIKTANDIVLNKEDYVLKMDYECLRRSFNTLEDEYKSRRELLKEKDKKIDALTKGTDNVLNENEDLKKEIAVLMARNKELYKQIVANTIGEFTSKQERINF